MSASHLHTDLLSTLRGRAPMVTRAGDVMQVGDALRLALELADTAIASAERAGAPLLEVLVLRRLHDQIQRCL